MFAEALLLAWEKYAIEVTGDALPMNCISYDEETNTCFVGHSIDLAGKTDPLILNSGVAARMVLLAYDYAEVKSEPAFIN